MLKQRFPDIVGPHKEDICYATTNRQEAVKSVAPRGRCADRGRRAELVQLAAAARGRRARRLQGIGAGAARRRYRLDIFEGIRTLGVTAGASAPEVMVEEIIDAFAACYDLDVETVSAAEENGSSRCRVRCASQQLCSLTVQNLSTMLRKLRFSD